MNGHAVRSLHHMGELVRAFGEVRAAVELNVDSGDGAVRALALR